MPRFVLQHLEDRNQMKPLSTLDFSYSGFVVLEPMLTGILNPEHPKALLDPLAMGAGNPKSASQSRSVHPPGMCSAIASDAWRT